MIQHHYDLPAGSTTQKQKTKRLTLQYKTSSTKLAIKLSGLLINFAMALVICCYDPTSETGTSAQFPIYCVGLLKTRRAHLQQVNNVHRSKYCEKYSSQSVDHSILILTVSNQYVSTVSVGIYPYMNVNNTIVMYINDTC